jgi:phage shock protein A
MNIDLEQILGSNLVSDSTLESAIHLLEESLPSYRRDLAYALANIRRAEQKYKQVREDLSRYDRDLELAKSQNNSDLVKIFSSDRLN